MSLGNGHSSPKEIGRSHTYHTRGNGERYLEDYSEKLQFRELSFFKTIIIFCLCLNHPMMHCHFQGMSTHLGILDFEIGGRPPPPSLSYPALSLSLDFSLPPHLSATPHNCHLGSPPEFDPATPHANHPAPPITTTSPCLSFSLPLPSRSPFRSISLSLSLSFTCLPRPLSTTTGAMLTLPLTALTSSLSPHPQFHTLLLNHPSIPLGISLALSPSPHCPSLLAATATSLLSPTSSPRQPSLTPPPTTSISLSLPTSHSPNLSASLFLSLADARRHSLVRPLPPLLNHLSID